MPRVPLAAAAINFISGIAWAVRLTFGESPWGTDVATMLAADLILLSAIVAIASLLRPARWVRNLAGALGVIWAALAVILSADAAWMVATACSLAGLALLWSRPSDPWFRADTRPDRVPVKATVLTLALLSLPAVVAITSDVSVSPVGWVLVAVAIGSGWAYGRAFPAMLWFLRLALPLFGLVASLGLTAPAALALLGAVTATTALAWTADARLAVQPLVPRRVEGVSILPEMVPTELMESAGLDRLGRPKADS